MRIKLNEFTRIFMYNKYIFIYTRVMIVYELHLYGGFSRHPHLPGSAKWSAHLQQGDIISDEMKVHRCMDAPKNTPQRLMNDFLG